MDSRLATFIDTVAAVLGHQQAPPPAPCPDIAPHLAALIAEQGWLSDEQQLPDPAAYRRQCLYEHPQARFSIGCFVWAPGQRTPIHDHRSWGVIGVLSGSITSETFVQDGAGLRGEVPVEIAHRNVAWVHPRLGDIHRIGGGPQGGISIHVYGCGFQTVCQTLYPD